MIAGQRYTASVTMRNTGTTTWSAAHLYRLGAQNPQDNGIWGKTRVPLPNSVAPGEDVTFNFTVIAPFTSSAQFQWRMIQDGVQWFGDYTTSQTVSIGGSSASAGDVQYGPFSDLFASRIAPEHRTGKPGDDLLSGNFNWGHDLVGLAGRSGLNLNLGLSYNSLATWTKVVPPATTVRRPEEQQPISWTLIQIVGFQALDFGWAFLQFRGRLLTLKRRGIRTCCFYLRERGSSCAKWV